MDICVREHLKLLGMRVEDRVTGFTGIVSSVSFDLYGCIQAIVTPPAGEAGKQEDSRWYDVVRLKVISSKPAMDPPKYDYGDIAEGKHGPTDKPSGKW